MKWKKIIPFDIERFVLIRYTTFKFSVNDWFVYSSHLVVILKKLKTSKISKLSMTIIGL